MTASALTAGFHAVPPGMLATVVTTLEMRAPPAAAGVAPPPEVSLHRMELVQPDTYRALFRAVGEPWLWTSRLLLADDALAAIIHHPDVVVLAVRNRDDRIGLLELDFRVSGACELAFFGLVPGWTGRGLGRWLMGEAVRVAWERPITRFWVHTCDLDDPAALSFYRRNGFVPIAREVEILEDPRATGLLPPHIAPRVPLI